MAKDFAALWDLLWDLDSYTAPTYTIALDLLEAAIASADLAVAWRDLQLGYLDRWRVGETSAAPLYWAGLAAMGFSA